jgi:PII-like signaling protein
VVNEDCLKLTIYFGERDRTERRFLADALVDISARSELQISLVTRGAEGFGIKQHLRTDRLLSLSEELPLVYVGVDTCERIQAALEEVNRLRLDGLVSLERARMLTGRIEPTQLPPDLHEETKLTAYFGRHERVNGRPAYEAVVDHLHRRGVAGATVLLGVDGTAHGVRRRAKFFGVNARVPLMVIAVGDGQRIGQLLPDLGAMLAEPVMTLERVRVCKRDGRLLAEPRHVPETDAAGLGVWQKLMFYAGEQARSDGHPLHHRTIRALRSAGASGATSLRGIWGITGTTRPTVIRPGNCAAASPCSPSSSTPPSDAAAGSRGWTTSPRPPAWSPARSSPFRATAPNSVPLNRSCKVPLVAATETPLLAPDVATRGPPTKIAAASVLAMYAPTSASQSLVGLVATVIDALSTAISPPATFARRRRYRST